jgi:uncharacterized pyridoxal phosphate-containing UPF0001 family protein
MPVSLGKLGKVLKPSSLPSSLEPVLQRIRTVPKARQEFIQSNLNELVTRIARNSTSDVRLVVDTHGRSTSEIRAAYDVGQRHFAERFWRNIRDKAVHLPVDIKWHVLGAWRMNQARLMGNAPGLWAVESVDTWPKARALERGLHQKTGFLPPAQRVRVFIQVNVGEEDGINSVVLCCRCA